jgi:SAM-dependent methyltransferase
MDFYQKDYDSLTATGNPENISARILHKSLERGLSKMAFPMVLEVGANRGEHSLFVKHAFNQYISSDLHVPAEGSEYSSDNRLTYETQNVEQLSYSSNTFDRVISTCLFHHLPNPEIGFIEVRRVAKIGGLISILLPTDPSISYRSLRSLATVLPAKRVGRAEEINLIHAREHRNHFYSLRNLLNHVFVRDSIDIIYPTKIPLTIFNPFLVYSIVKSATND